MYLFVFTNRSNKDPFHEKSTYNSGKDNKEKKWYRFHFLFLSLTRVKVFKLRALIRSVLNRMLYIYINFLTEIREFLSRDFSTEGVSLCEISILK